MTRLNQMIREEAQRLNEASGPGEEAPLRFEEIIVEVEELVREAMTLLRDASRSKPQLERELRAAEGYWYAHIMTAIGGEAGSQWGRTHATTMNDTLQSLQGAYGMEGDEDEEY